MTKTLQLRRLSAADRSLPGAISFITIWKPVAPLGGNGFRAWLANQFRQSGGMSLRFRALRGTPSRTRIITGAAMPVLSWIRLTMDASAQQ